MAINTLVDLNKLNLRVLMRVRPSGSRLNRADESPAPVRVSSDEAHRPRIAPQQRGRAAREPARTARMPAAGGAPPPRRRCIATLRPPHPTLPHPPTPHAPILVLCHPVPVLRLFSFPQDLLPAPDPPQLGRPATSAGALRCAVRAIRPSHQGAPRSPSGRKPEPAPALHLKKESGRCAAAGSERSAGPARGLGRRAAQPAEHGTGPAAAPAPRATGRGSGVAPCAADT